MSNLDELFDVQYVAVSATKLAQVEKIIELAKGRPTFVDGDKDWEVIWGLFVLWYTEYPEQYHEFQKSIAEIRSQLKNKDGLFKENGADLWQRQLEIPQTFYNMIKAIYPDQKWDRKFVKGLAIRIPILKVAENI